MNENELQDVLNQIRLWLTESKEKQLDRLEVLTALMEDDWFTVGLKSYQLRDME